MTNKPERAPTRGSAAVATVALLASLWSIAAFAGDSEPVRIVSGLAGGSGSTVGPNGALYVTEPAAGRISRVDPRTGKVTTFATGLPPLIPAIGIGGAMDVEFLNGTAYVLVTLVGADVGGTSIVGVYRMDGPNRFTPIADIGAFSLANPPSTPFFVPTGVQYAMERYGDALLVTDGHHNRVLRVTRNGAISELIAFDNVVPTGLAVAGAFVFVSQAGPIPHLPENGRVLAFGPWRHFVWEVASGAPLLTDVELSSRLRAVRAIARHVERRRRRLAGVAVHGLARAGETGRHLQRGRRAVEHSNFARDHRRHGVRREPYRRDLENRRHFAAPSPALKPGEIRERGAGRRRVDPANDEPLVWGSSLFGGDVNDESSFRARASVLFFDPCSERRLRAVARCR